MNAQENSTFKGTPGPYFVDHFQYAGEHQRDIYAELPDGSRVQVAAVAEMLGLRPHWEAEANAELFAAAPDLLAVCLRFIGLRYHVGEPGNEMGDACAWCNSMQAFHLPLSDGTPCPAEEGIAVIQKAFGQAATS